MDCSKRFDSQNNIYKYNSKTISTIKKGEYISLFFDDSPILKNYLIAQKPSLSIELTARHQ